MSGKIVDKNNFIVNFRIEEIHDIKRDIQMRKEGFQFFYAIDTYDIMNHFLPYTESGFLNSGNKNMIAQRAIAYDKFFNTFLTSRLIVLDEYKIELLAAKNHIERQIKNSGFLTSNMERLSEEIGKLEKGESIDKEKLRKNIELVLFLLILSENKGNINRNFFSFLENKLSVFDFNTSDSELDHILNTVFADATPTDNVEKIYDLFVENNAFYLTRLNSDTDRYTYLSNSYRDVEVIDRLNSINNKLRLEYPERKVNFIYLSSAPLKSREIFSLFKQNVDNESGYLHYNFHRNIFQCFLFKILTEEFPDANDDTPILILQSLEKLITQVRQLSKSDSAGADAYGDDEMMNMLDRILGRYSANIDNHFYFKIYNKYKAILDLNISGKMSEVNSILSKVRRYIDQENIMTEGSDILFNISQYKQTYLLYNILNRNKSIVTIRIRFGLDIVRDSFHQLPFLLLIQDGEEECARDLYPVLEMICEIFNNKETDIQEIVPNLNNIFKEISKDSDNIRNISLQFLLTTYFYLITDVGNAGASQKKDNSSKELELIEVLRKQKRILENAAINLALEPGGNKIKIRKKNIVFAQEFDYVVLWLLRRNKQFSEAIRMGNELLAKSDDPRFCHGLALGYVSQAYDILLEGNATGDAIETCIALFANALVFEQKAKDGYGKLLAEVDNEFARLLIRKNLIALCNSIADTSTRKYALMNFSQDALLQQARGAIEELKIFCGDAGLDYSSLAIYNFTEAEIEYYEALQYWEKDNLPEANLKILDATDRLYAVKRIEVAMHDSFKEIAVRVEELRNRIFIRRGVLR
ncbi:hypothetical protein [Puia dinghuensis]|uniref:Uncharacterized protein n=1 Tax=Puia dinghuensis TaxID=1792502 RepID=A0A8J2XVS0_9BACT|nr:hypothetical protein [Puia dinghuensis]GGB17776.1 hypothetical protein GCM10011511_46980 [Puia dinghuensis]